jgi:hypothetical protein
VVQISFFSKRCPLAGKYLNIIRRRRKRERENKEKRKKKKE